jgi:hypothetical protein
MRKVLIAAASVLALAAPAEAKARFRPFVFFTLPMHHHDSVWRKSDYTQAPAYTPEPVSTPQSQKGTSSQLQSQEEKVTPPQAQNEMFDIGSGQHHVDIHAGTLPIEHDENAACSRTFNRGFPANEPADCEMSENKSKRQAERLWPSVPDDRRKECLGSLDDEIDISFWSDFWMCLER